MDGEQPQRRADYFVRALAVVISACVAHFALSHALLPLLANPPLDWLERGPREAVVLIVAATSLTQLAAFYLRTQYSGPSQVTHSVPAALRRAPAVVAAVLIPLSYDHTLLDGPIVETLPSIAPVVAATWSSALIVALLERRLLHTLASRAPPSVDAAIETSSPPYLAGSFARVLGGATAAVMVLTLGALASKRDIVEQLQWSPATVLPVLGLVLMVVIAAIAGSSLGQSPGRDALSIARRLDALGYNTEATTAWPVVVTSADEVGELFSKLEDLRLRLSREATLYQNALNRTRDADAAKADFLGAVSHELRTPLNTVCGFAQLLLEGDRSGRLTEPQAEDVRLIQAGGERLLELINDILDISMIETGELRFEFAREEPAKLVDESVRIHQSLLRDKDVTLAADLSPGLPPITCDRRRIGQILANLISNAIKFTEKGSITVRATYDARQERVVIRVIDTGVGIAPNDLDAIFEAYSQVGAAKRRKTGTGLGLAIARSIAVHHEGSLTVDSTLAEGSTFTLTLPLNPREPRHRLADAVARTEAGGLQEGA
jgi:signal transduction histidine kinase